MKIDELASHINDAFIKIKPSEIKKKNILLGSDGKESLRNHILLFSEEILGQAYEHCARRKANLIDHSDLNQAKTDLDRRRNGRKGAVLIAIGSLFAGACLSNLISLASSDSDVVFDLKIICIIFGLCFGLIIGTIGFMQQ